MTLHDAGSYTGWMIGRRLFVVAVVLCGLLSLARPHAQAIQRGLYVSVTDQAGTPVPDLGPSDFIVKEDGLAREVLRVGPAEEPMQIAILVDNSQAARNDIGLIRQALPEFVTAMTAPNEAGRRNQLAIIGVGERPTILANYSSSPAELQKGINRIWSLPGSGTYLLDGIVETSQGFKKRSATRPVMIAITREAVEYSNRHFDQVLDPLHASGAAFYALAIGQPSTSLSDEARNRSIVLDRGPTTTGGYREQLLTPMALEGKLKLLANQLTHEYLVTYARPQSLIPPEQVTIAAKNPALKARGTPINDEASHERGR